ncbi:type II toxin-antitoxin system VapC family toxin [Caenispirillum bisanense]|uniref:Ribonuclease VapC n=1 Tax=Caenispirillum bisanense TaxID=414052 RepID=A0A286GA01_9PROT|nr:type II toxin-antitoxin system VapC family toxin [Caenispirillum bisanense]SOD92355.1 tRNA(fMet)-specific endonuclease VapC [Caenispirillum bisanense]
MSCAVDSNVCIAILRNKAPIVARRLAAEFAAGRTVALPSIVLFELRYGIERSPRPDHNRRQLEALLKAPFRHLPFEEEDAVIAARIRADLAAAGTPIGAYDILIAAQALRTGSTLVTNNTGEFRRVQGLALADWTASS